MLLSAIAGLMVKSIVLPTDRPRTCGPLPQILRFLRPQVASKFRRARILTDRPRTRLAWPLQKDDTHKSRGVQTGLQSLFRQLHKHCDITKWWENCSEPHARDYLSTQNEYKTDLRETIHRMTCRKSRSRPVGDATFGRFRLSGVLLVNCDRRSRVSFSTRGF